MMKQAKEDVEKIDKNSLIEMKSFAAPPRAVQLVMEAVCNLLGKKQTDWASAKVLLLDLKGFIESLVDFDKDNIPEKRLAILKK